MIGTIVFDLDDTLYDEVDYCRSGLRAVAQFLAGSHHGLSVTEFFDAFWLEFESGNRTRVFNAVLEHLGIKTDERLIQNLVRVYRSHKPHIELARPTRLLLDALRGPYTLALLTDGYLPAQRLKVRALKIERHFAALVFTEQLGRQCWKPSAAGFEELIRTLHQPAESMVYVADNPAKDFLAPNQLGMRSIQISRPRRLHAETPPTPAHAAQRMIGDLDQLTSALADLDGTAETPSGLSAALPSTAVPTP